MRGREPCRRVHPSHRPSRKSRRWCYRPFRIGRGLCGRCEVQGDVLWVAEGQAQTLGSVNDTAFRAPLSDPHSQEAISSWPEPSQVGRRAAASAVRAAVSDRRSRLVETTVEASPSCRNVPSRALGCSNSRRLRVALGDRLAERVIRVSDCSALFEEMTGPISSDNPQRYNEQPPRREERPLGAQLIGSCFGEPPCSLSSSRRSSTGRGTRSKAAASVHT